jgi:hypothetical protein
MHRRTAGRALRGGMAAAALVGDSSFAVLNGNDAEAEQREQPASHHARLAAPPP